jgi:RimJ/RimL family protein N-acetyltransferase
MASNLHPLMGLVARTDRLTLSAPTDEELPELVEVARAGIHAPGARPFAYPWTETPEPQFGWQFAQHQWQGRASAGPAQWALNLMVRVDGEICGMQSVRGTDFPTLRTVDTGSWISLSRQGQGLGTLVRAAALELSFAHLGALHAISAAFEDNLASQAVSRKLGYQDNGRELYSNAGQPMWLLRYLMDRDAWLASDRRPQMTVEGLEAVREWLELPAP